MTRLEQRLEQSMAGSDERMTRIEQSMVASNERMTRIEEGLGRVEKIVESNNRFLESFSQNLQRYTDSMNNLATEINGVIATTNQDRQETNSRLASIQRQVAAIANFQYQHRKQGVILPIPSGVGVHTFCRLLISIE